MPGKVSLLLLRCILQRVGNPFAGPICFGRVLKSTKKNRATLCLVIASTANR